MGKKIEAPRLRTALHIVQGALAKALDEDLPLLGATGAICGLRLRQERVCVGARAAAADWSRAPQW